MRLWNGGRDRRPSQLATYLQTLTNQHLLGGINIGQELDAAGDLGGDAAAIL